MKTIAYSTIMILALFSLSACYDSPAENSSSVKTDKSKCGTGKCGEGKKEVSKPEGKCGSDK